MRHGSPDTDWGTRGQANHAHGHRPRLAPEDPCEGAPSTGPRLLSYAHFPTTGSRGTGEQRAPSTVPSGSGCPEAGPSRESSGAAEPGHPGAIRLGDRGGNGG
jgi:hypothetical protein